MRIAIDLMGGESPPTLLFEGVLKAALQFPDFIFVVLATQSVLDQIQSPSNLFSISEPFLSKLEFHAVSQVIEMDEEPLVAIRQKKNSSLLVGLNLLKERCVDGFVTSGNTGALIAAATLFIPLLGRIKRPALLANLPTKQGKTSIIDVGGSLRALAHHLVQFAEMGVAYQQCCLQVDCPTVGLLNVGIESQKGTKEIRKAYEQLLKKQSTDLNMRFLGNVEGREVFEGVANVLITDGFAGNVLLKTAEGVYAFILEQLKPILETLSPQQKTTIFDSLRTQFDYEEYMGAIICGIDGVVFKCHGNSTAKGMLNTIKGVVEAVENDYIARLKKMLSKL